MMNETEISLNQLKIIASKYGYNLHKKTKRKYVKLLHCPICDKKMTFIDNMTFSKPYAARVCKKCGFRGYASDNIVGTNAMWNAAVEDCIKNKGKNFVDGGDINA